MQFIEEDVNRDGRGAKHESRRALTAQERMEVVSNYTGTFVVLTFASAISSLMKQKDRQM